MGCLSFSVFAALGQLAFWLFEKALEYSWVIVGLLVLGMMVELEIGIIELVKKFIFKPSGADMLSTGNNSPQRDSAPCKDAKCQC